MKYATHGVLFAAVMLVYGLFMWYFFAWGPFLWSYSPTMIIAVIGAIVVVTLVFFGLANSYLAKAVWGISPKMTAKSLLGQGLLLTTVLPFFSYGMAALLAIGITGEFVTVTLMMFVLDAFVSGYMGREVALEFVPAIDGKEELASVSDRHRTCPSCGTSFISRDVGEAVCPHCQNVFRVEGEGPRLDWA